MPPSLPSGVPLSHVTYPKEWGKFQIPKEIPVTPQDHKKIGISPSGANLILLFSTFLLPWVGPVGESTRGRKEVRVN